MTPLNDERRPGQSGPLDDHLQADAHTYDTERSLPASHDPLPKLDHVVGEPHAIDQSAFIEAQNSPEFIELRRRFRSFAFPMTAFFLIWYFGYVLASVYLKGFMSQSIGLGNLNLGHVLGLLQFVTTFVITWLYLRHMTTNIDPLAADLRAKLEGADR